MAAVAAGCRAAALVLLALSPVALGGGCRGRPPRVESILIYEVDPQTAPLHQPLNMPEVLAACRRRLSGGRTPLAEVRQCGARQIEIGVYGKDPAVVRRVQALLALRGTWELRILANRRDHAALVGQALATPSEWLRDAQQKPLGRWVPVWPGREASLNARDPIVTRTRRVNDREQLEVLVVCDKCNVTGAYLLSARVVAGTSGYPEIEFRLNTDGGRLLSQLTTENLPDPLTSFRRQLGILLDGRLVSAPGVQAVISQSGRITGQFTTDEAQLLVDVLNAGSLPLPLREAERR